MSTAPILPGYVRRTLYVRRAPIVSEADCDVAIAGGGLVGLTLAYELVSRGARVTVIDAGYPGRATDAGAGILAPDTHPVDEPFWWDMVQGAGAHYPSLLERIRADGVDTEPSGYATCGLLSIGLRESEEHWFAPFAERVLRAAAGRVTEITPAAAVSLFPPLGTVHRVLHSPGAARVDGRGLAEALRQALAARGVHFLSGVVSGVAVGRSGSEGGSGGGSDQSVQRVVVDGQDDVRCGSLAVAGGAWSAAMGEWLTCPLPISPTKGQIVHVATSEESGSWPIVQPLLTHYLVPWPGGRVACGGTFEPGAAFSASVTVAGLHELLRECLGVAPGLADAEYLHTRVGLRPTSPDDRPVVGPVPGWGNVWVSSGHGANGLLLGPYTSKLLALPMMGEGGAGAGGAPIPGELDPSRFA
jgi:D-amino-acid dehydrogenase